MPVANLEIFLFRRDAGNASVRYGIELRFAAAGSENEKAASGATPLDTDDPEFRARGLDPAAYGSYLADRLLAEPAIRSFFDQARAAAQAQDASLHIRLAVGADAAELHSLRWEMLRLPGGAPLSAATLTGEKLTFSRYLATLDWRPVRPRSAADIRALIVIADPSDAARFRLAPVNKAQELAAARAGLGDIPASELAKRGQVTLNNIVAALRDSYDILYLVAHGMLVDGEPWLFLEKEDGSADRVPGRELAIRIPELEDRPRLAVLISCQSAGTGTARAHAAETASREDGILAALGPQLAEAGVPAVIAMQGNITMQTAAAFMPVFFRELRRDGLADRAMAVARGAVRDRPDWWMPVLFTGLKGGRIWEPAGPDTQMLDAAIANRVFVDRATTLYAQIRHLTSPGLRALLAVEELPGISPANIRSKQFELDFPLDARGAVQPMDIQLAVRAPDFDPPYQQQPLRVHPQKDSELRQFQLTPKKPGVLHVMLEVLRQDGSTSSRALQTECSRSSAEVREEKLVFRVFSIPLLTINRSYRVTTVEDAHPILETNPSELRPPQPDSRPPGAQIDVNQRVSGDVSGEVTGVKVGTIQGPVSFQGPVTLNFTNLPPALAELRPTAGPTVDDLSQPVIKTKSFEPVTVPIPAGPFLMGTAQGSGAPAWEMPRQTLLLPDYRIGKYPVTNAQYLAFVRDKRIAVPPEAGWELAAVGQVPPAGRENHPMVGITWDDAVAYCRWLSDKTGRIYRLPSEAEWEKAASWGTEVDKETGRQVDKEKKRRYPWGDTFDATKCNTAESGIGTTTAVGAYSDKGGDSPCGAADMAGNVWEWTSTRWGTERSQPQYAPPYDPGDGRENQDKDEPFREYRIVRGGSYQDGADRAICTARGRDAANKGDRRRGFRVAMDI